MKVSPYWLTWSSLPKPMQHRESSGLTASFAAPTAATEKYSPASSTPRAVLLWSDDRPPISPAHAGRRNQSRTSGRFLVGPRH
ncbi:hypothetical protein SUDANB120_06198 (plasmid) [Streptomyces sp. enrichment culture]